VSVHLLWSMFLAAANVGYHALRHFPR
jgi:hypothetical protein